MIIKNFTRKNNSYFILSLTLIISICAATLLLLNGCNSEKQKIESAIIAAVDRFNDSNENFNLTYSDLEINAEPDEYGNGTLYTASLLRPNVTILKNEDIIPATEVFFDLNSASPTDYENSFRKTVSDNIFRHFQINFDAPRETVTGRFLLTQNNSEYNASFLNVEEIKTNFNGLLNDKINELLHESKEYKKLNYAQKVKQTFPDIFGSEILNNVTISEIKISGDKVTVYVSHPNLKALFEAASDSVLNEFQAGETPLFEKLTLSSVKTSLTEKLSKVAKDIELVTTEFDYTESIDGGEISNTRATLLDEHAENLLMFINSNLVKEKTKPKTGILSGKSSGENVECVNESSTDAVIIAKNNKNTAIITIYVKSGDSFSFKLSEGEYIIEQASGKKWYGEEFLFGSAGNYTVSKQTLKIKSGYNHTISISKNENT